MITWRLAVPAILVAAAVAACITYFATLISPQRLEDGQRSSLTGSIVAAPNNSNVSKGIHPPNTEDDIVAYQRAAEAILKQALNAKASADEPVITGPVPLPKRRPLLRP